MCKKNQLEEQESFFASILPEDNKQKNDFKKFCFHFAYIYTQLRDYHAKIFYKVAMIFFSLTLNIDCIVFDVAYLNKQ